MKWGRAFTAIVLLAVWLPATTRCFLEKAQLLEARDDCCAESSSPNPCQNQSESSCCELAEGNYRSGSVEVILPIPEVPLPATSATELKLCDPPPPTRASDDVLHLQSSWQFTQRAAPPARAPSSAS